MQPKDHQILELLLDILPSNPIQPFSDGNTLQIIFLAVFFIYRPLNKDFKVEEQIREAFPDNLPEEEYIP